MISEKRALEIMAAQRAPPDLIAHVEAVHSACSDMLSELKRKKPTIKVDEKLVLAGALLHDLGRTVTHGVGHGVAGARIIRQLSTDNDPDMEKIALICERHIGGGITKSEAAKLGLPPGDYAPKSLEEKIISYCDNLVDEDEQGRSVLREPAWVEAKYERKHGKNSDSARMVKELNLFFADLLG